MLVDKVCCRYIYQAEVEGTQHRSLLPRSPLELLARIPASSQIVDEWHDWHLYDTCLWFDIEIRPFSSSCDIPVICNDCETRAERVHQLQMAQMHKQFQFLKSQQ